MAFNTTSFIAGVGSVVVVLSTGFAGGYFIANPTRVDPPNRLQRLAAEDHSVAKAADKPEVVATAAPVPAATAAPATVAPAAVTPTVPAAPAQAPVEQASAEQPAAAPAAAEAKAPERAQTVAVRETASPAAERSDTDKVIAQKAADKDRATEAKFAERKRSEARKYAEQQRKQRELEVATVAVRRIIHERDGQDVIMRDRDAPEVVANDAPEAPGPAMPHFNLFGQ